MTSTGADLHTGVPVTAPGADDAVAAVVRLRTRIDDIDQQLIELLQQRITLSSHVQEVRKTSGGPRLSLARESEIISRYRAALGPLGTEVAMLALRLARGGSGQGRGGGAQSRGGGAQSQGGSAPFRGSTGEGREPR